MNETELEKRTLQVHIGLPPSYRKKLHEEREKQRQERIRQKQIDRMSRRIPAVDDFSYIPTTQRGRGRGRGIRINHSAFLSTFYH